MRILVLLVALTLLAPAAVAVHRSVGGDVTTSFPPAKEAGGPDVVQPGVLSDDMEVVAVTGAEGAAISYTNTLDPALATLDRVSPPDQTYEAGSGVGYFDAVLLQYAGGAGLTFGGIAGDPFAKVNGEGDHDWTISPNTYYQLPDINSIPGTDGVITSGYSGTMYPTLMQTYVYLFGDGTAADGSGNDLVAGQGPFEGLVPADACAPRGTERCQLFNQADVNALVAGDTTGRQAAICGWSPTHHFHPGSDVNTCRDYDFSYMADNAQGQQQSATWVWSATPGWYANSVEVVPDELGAVDSDPIGMTEWSSENIVIHFTVGAAFDPDVGPPTNKRQGDGPLSCLEPGFDVNNFVAHEVDVFQPPNEDVAAVVDDSEGIVDDVLDQLGPVGDAVDLVVDTANDVLGQGTDVLLEQRQGRPYHAEDTLGAISVSEATRLDCIDPEDGGHDMLTGKITTVDGETWENWLESWIWQGAAGAGLAPLVDPIEATNPDDDHENPGGGVAFFFTSPNGRPGLAERSTEGNSLPFYDGFYDTELNSGENCAVTNPLGGTICIGDFMRGNGYADPTGLVFVFRMNGPVAFTDANSVGANTVFQSYADTNSHCVIGASVNVFSLDGQTIQEPQVLDAVLARASPGASIDGLGATAAKDKLRQELCDGADSLDYFPGPGFNDHEAGGSVSNPFGWVIPTGYAEEAKGQLDLYYVLGVDKETSINGDKLGLNELGIGDDTVVDADADSVTFVWQERTVIGSEGGI